MNHDFFLQAAIAQAEKSLAEGGIPIGSVLVYQNRIIGQGHNQRIQKKNPILHGEMDALANAGRHPAHIYQHCILYTTLSPCAMCSGAIVLYQIPEVVIGENQTFQGEEAYLLAKGVKLTQMQDANCVGMMQRFIQQNPQLWHEDIGQN
jgi:creatinine deaminase